MGGRTLDQSQLQKEEGTGYFKTYWPKEAIKETMAKVEIKNANQGVAWGALHWEYFEDIDKIQSSKEAAINLKKKLFREESTATGRVSHPLHATTQLIPGDKIIVRLEISVDRDMEYLHLKYLRASALEPIHV